MKAPLRVPCAQVREGRWELPAEVARYVVKVHRLREGDSLQLFDPEQSVSALAQIAHVQFPLVEVDVRELVQTEQKSLPVTLFQSLGKGDKPDQAVEDATVLGMQRVVFLESERTVVKWSGGGLRGDRLRRIAVQAARQCGRGDLPELEGPWSWEQTLDALSGSFALLCAWHETARPLLQVLEDWVPEQPLSLLVGPEGGFSEREVEEARERGCQVVSLGPLVLRTEAAATVSLGAIRAFAEARS